MQANTANTKKVSSRYSSDTGGEFVTFDDNPHTFEGVAPRPGRMIIFKFPSEDEARQWYADPEYQALSEHRRAGTKLEFLTMVHGMAPRN